MDNEAKLRVAVEFIMSVVLFLGIASIPFIVGFSVMRGWGLSHE